MWVRPSCMCSLSECPTGLCLTEFAGFGKGTLKLSLLADA